MQVLALLLALAGLVSADNVRVEYKLMQYTNDGSVLANGKSCGSSCDPKLIGYVDTEKALNPWPGPKPDDKTWATIFQATATDRTPIGKIVSRDVCSTDFNKANLRIKVIDINKIFPNAEITQFECLSGGFRDVARSESTADWSAPKFCDGKSNPSKVRLQYAWRIFNVPTNECGRSISGASSARQMVAQTTKKPGGIFSFLGRK